jgi:hypothetical protein
MRILIATLLIPITATATPCRTEHRTYTGKPAPCDGLLSPAQTALNGALCLDDTLPTCQALRRRDAASAARVAVALARDVSEVTARANRWRSIALAPVPPAPGRIVVRQRGVPTWAVGAVAVVSAIAGVWLGWRASGLVRATVDD